MAARPSTLTLTLLTVTLALGGCRAEVAHDLEEPEANRVVAVLGDHGIPARTTSSGRGDDLSFTVSVPSAELTRSLQILRENDLPGQREQGLAEVFDRSGLLPTPTEERARLVQALQGELIESIESIDGVLAARVHLSVTEGRRGISPVDAQPAPTTASVLVRYQGEAPPLTEAQLRGLVAGAVDGLEPERVTTVMVRQGPSPQAAARSCDLVALGPLAVTPGSVGPLRLWLGLSTGLAALLALIAVLLSLRSRRARRRVAELEARLAPAADAPAGGTSTRAGG